MKIAIVRTKYVSHGGAENYLTLLGNEFVRQGHEVHIFSNRWERDNNSFIFHKVPVIRGISFMRALSFAISSYFLLKKERFDIIISFDRTFYQDIYRAGDGCHREWLEQRKMIESPLKNLLIALNPFHRIILYLERRIYIGKGCKRIISNSSKGKEDIIRYYETPEEKITVVYNGVDTERFSPSNRALYRDEIRRKYGMTDNDIVILFVGSGSKRKGLGFLLKAIYRLQTSDFRPKTLIVGKVDYNYYKRMARSLGIEEDIIFAGTTNTIERFYAASDIFILPSIYDPFSNACLEAMASGLPVITTQDNGASEVIEDGIDGFVLEDPFNVGEIASKIKLLMDQDLREAFGKRAREKAEGFMIGDSVRRIVEISKEVKNG